MKILIFGLPGSGKTTFAKELAYHFTVPHYNADTFREYYDDWDFSEAGRVRQFHRMNSKDWGIIVIEGTYKIYNTPVFTVPPNEL